MIYKLKGIRQRVSTKKSGLDGWHKDIDKFNLEFITIYEIHIDEYDDVIIGEDGKSTDDSECLDRNEGVWINMGWVTRVKTDFVGVFDAL